MRIRLVLFGMAMLGVASCGGSGGSVSEASGADQPYVESMMSGLTADSTARLTDAQARCLAQNMVAVVGIEAFVAAGIEPQDLSTGSASVTALPAEKSKAILSVMFDGRCFDFR